MSFRESESDWLDQLKAGDSDAAAQIWARYVHRLLGLARKKLGGLPRRAADEEDVALSAFNSFCQGAMAGNFAQLNDQDDLWTVMAMIVSRKALRHTQRENAQKRGGGKVRGESVLNAPRREGQPDGLERIMSLEPTPETLAAMDEAVERLLAQLDDEMLQQIALLKLDGHTNQEIAEQIGRTVRSVERKLNLIRSLWSEAGEADGR